MKRSPWISGLSGLALAASLVIVPTAVATTVPQTDPTSTASESATPTPEPTGQADSSQAPAEPTPTETTQAPTAEPTGPQDPGTTGPGTLAPAHSPTPTVIGDPGMAFENKQLRGEASIISLHRNGCVLTFEVAVQVSGAYIIEVWDDGALIANVNLVGEAGTTHTATYTMGANVGTRAPGYDFILVDAMGPAVQMLVWDFEGSKNVMAQCAAAASADSTGLPGGVVSPPAASPQLARTGAATGALALGALALAGAGVALRRARRRG